AACARSSGWTRARSARQAVARALRLDALAPDVLEEGLGHVEESAHDRWIEVLARAALDLGLGHVERLGLRVRAVPGDRVEGVDDHEDPGAQRDLLASEPARIAAAVPLLVVRVDDWHRALQERDLLDQLLADLRVAPHDLPLFVGERAWLQQ